MNNGPQQFVVINGISIPTEEFVKDREGIIKRLQGVNKELGTGEMQHKTLDGIKKQEDTEELNQENEVETPVTIVPETTTFEEKTTESIETPVEVKKTSNTKKTSWKK